MIEIRGIRKDFDGVRALDSLSLTIREGDLFGYIGPNGAGKTTTIKILATLEYPDRGGAHIAGIDVVEKPEEIRRVIGYMPELFGIYENMPVREYLDLFARIYGVPHGAINGVIELTGLESKRDAAASTLSKGNRQRLYIARILLHNPSVLLLDEPASGLDPMARIELRELLKELHRMGKTILISSHILADLEDICNTVGIIEQGRLLVSGELATLREQLRADFEVSVRVNGDPAPLLEWLHAHPRVNGVEVRRDFIEFHFRGERGEVHETLRQAIDLAPIYSFEASEGSLEDIFMRITQGRIS
jgi:ABC-2 type transport system ATP-binding protein